MLMPILSHKFRVFMSTDANPMIERLAKFVGMPPKRLYDIPITNYVSKISVDRLENVIHLTILQDKEIAGLIENIFRKKVMIDLQTLDSQDEVVEHSSYRCKMIGYDTHLAYNSAESATYNLQFRIINGTR